MPINFEDGQPFVLNLPGGIFKGTVIGKGKYPGDWIVHVDDDENPTEKVIRSYDKNPEAKAVVDRVLGVGDE